MTSPHDIAPRHRIPLHPPRPPRLRPLSAPRRRPAVSAAEAAAATALNRLELRDVDVRVGSHPVAYKLSFPLRVGEIGCMLGPSGAGKTRILRAIAGLDEIAGGELLIDGVVAATKKGGTAPEKRGIGMVFQDLALFPHLSVGENIAFGIRSLTMAARKRRVEELLKTVDLVGLEQRYPHQLSGGQRQRIALARSLAPKPRLLLLDEPFDGLDSDQREFIAAQVRSLLLEDQITALLVTHDQLEAFAFADCIGVLADGRLHQWDQGYNLYHKPASRFVADFIGAGVFLAGKVRDEKSVETGMGVFSGELSQPLAAGTAVDLLVRPDDIVQDAAIEPNATVVAKAFRGSEHQYTLEVGDLHRLLCVAPSHYDHALGDRIGIRLQPKHLAVFPR